MKVKNILKGKDGFSSTITLDLSEHEVSMLIQSAVVQALKDYVDKHERDTKSLDRSDLPNNSFKV